MAKIAKTAEYYNEALSRAESCRSIMNIQTVMQHYSNIGIEIDNIKPGENVLTFAAWKAKKRYVKRGEKGCAVVTYINTTKKNKKGEDEDICFPKTTYVFHISQTEENK